MDIGIMKIKAVYDLYIGGKSKGKDSEAGMLFWGEPFPDQLYTAICKLIDIYQQNGKKREAFHEFVNRYGIENLRSKTI